MEIVFTERHVLFWRKVRINSSFRVGDSKKPNFQPEIREHQLSSRLIWNKGEIWALPIIKQLFFLSH